MPCFICVPQLCVAILPHLVKVYSNDTIFRICVAAPYMQSVLISKSGLKLFCIKHKFEKFRKVIKRNLRIYFDLHVMRQPACEVITDLMPSLIARRWIGRQILQRPNIKLFGSALLVSNWCFCFRYSVVMFLQVSKCISFDQVRFYFFMLLYVDLFIHRDDSLINKMASNVYCAKSLKFC